MKCRLKEVGGWVSGKREGKREREILSLYPIQKAGSGNGAWGL